MHRSYTAVVSIVLMLGCTAPALASDTDPILGLVRISRPDKTFRYLTQAGDIIVSPVKLKDVKDIRTKKEKAKEALWRFRNFCKISMPVLQAGAYVCNILSYLK